MQPDMMLVLGIILGGLAVPSMLSAVSDRRAPRASAITVLIAGGLILLAINNKPGGYRLEDVPDAFYRVVAQFL